MGKKVKLKGAPGPWKGVEIRSIPEDYGILDRYVIRNELAEVIIATPPGPTVEPTYFATEVQLSPQEALALEKLKDILSKELEPPKPGEEEDAKRILLKTAEKLLRKYEGALGKFEEESREKLFYYLERDMTGFGPLNIVMEDYRIEDISCDGVNVPVYVWHRDYESIPTNIIFTDRDALDDFIIQLAHKSEKHISSAFPILDAMIYGKHRLAATFREEISPRGSTFTIRKFREKPFSVTELLESKLLSPEMAAYFWMLMEHKANILVAGATGSGKTTILNALSCFIKPRMKIVTCEETAELNIPSENWVRFVTRESYGLGAQKTGEITLYDLVKTSLRYRPDYLIVGEVRGEEAFVLFQAIATGHGGLSTIHAENIESAVKRLISPPMNIPPSHIPLIDAVALVERVSFTRPVDGKGYGRRIRYIWEVVDFGKYVTIAEWNPATDTFNVDLYNSVVIERIAMRIAKTKEEVIAETLRRAALLRKFLENKMIEIRDIAREIYSYYANPEQVLKKYGVEVEVIQVPASRGMEINKAETTFMGVSEEVEEDKVSEAILSILRTHDGTYPLWKIFIEMPASKITVFNALKKLRDSGIIEIYQSNVRMKES
ncbi:MAG: type II/IV secretion system ATPase subunit [Aigarchaeota archaeon]|nr:type II/IV secretion system ATPase subunit [Aigarchaeota archaeon]MDW8021895.1 type II/IV secretion system ATPase subunit [Nitrososphaerota archaeon]